MKKIVLASALALVCLGLTGVALADPVGGTQKAVEVVGAGKTDVYTIKFYAGQLARVRIEGDGDTDLDLYVYDELGNLIGKGDGPTDRETVVWTPRWTGKFTIRVANRSNLLANRYVLVAD